MAISYDIKLTAEEHAALHAKEAIIISALIKLKRFGGYRWSVDVRESGERALLFASQTSSGVLSYYRLTEIASLSEDAFVDDIEFNHRTPYPPLDEVRLPQV